MQVRRPSSLTAAVLPRARYRARWVTALAVTSAVVVGAAGAAGAVVGGTALAAFVLTGQGLLAWSWTRRQRASAGTAAIIAVAAVTCDVTVLARERDDAQIGDVAGVLGAAVVVVVLYQLARRRIRAPSGHPNGAGAPAVARTSTRGEPARVSADMATGLSGVGLVVLFAAALALGVQDREGGRALAAAGLLGVGVGVAASRLVAVLMAVAVADDRPPAPQAPHEVGVAATAGVALGVLAGAVLGALTDISAAEGAAVAGAGAGAALALDVGLARSLAAGGPAPVPLGSATASSTLAALLPFAVAAPVVYLVAHLLLP